METTAEASTSQAVDAFSESIKGLALQHQQMALSLCMERLALDAQPRQPRRVQLDGVFSSFLRALRKPRGPLPRSHHDGVANHPVIIVIDAESEPALCREARDE